MFLTVRARCFNHMDHHLFCAHPKGADLLAAKQWRSRRLDIQAYLFRIQQRFDRGAFAGAEFLFQRMCALFDLPRWAVVAASDEVRMQPEVRAAYRAFKASGRPL